MPPKKKLCRSKDQRSIIEVFRDSSDESENSSNDQTKPAPWKIRRNNHRPINLFLNGLNYIHGLNTTKKRILCSVISVPSMGKETAW